MINNVFPRLIHLVILVLVLVVTLIFYSCDVNDIIIYEPIKDHSSVEYKTFVTPEDADLHFSFEYPSYYPLGYTPPQPSLPITTVQIHPYSFKELSKGIFTNIEIWIIPIDGNYPAPETAVEEYMSKYGKKPESIQYIEPDSVQIEEHCVLVAGQEGLETIISYKEKPFPIMQDMPEPRANTSVVLREVFLYYNGMIWHISLFTDTGSYEQSRLIFEHILGTLKILD